jgi:DNA-binding transcriptional regulator YdaS (Cro superfamily)
MKPKSIIQQLIEHFGGQVKTAVTLGVKQPTVSGWLRCDHGMSAVTALKAEKLTGGQFKAVDLCPKLIDVA